MVKTYGIPLFRDPIYDGAADPTVIWNPEARQWWMYYTARRAFGPNDRVSYMHGTDIGMAASDDGGATWYYLGTAQGLEFESGRNSFWAPEVIRGPEDYHMYCSYVRGIRTDWSGTRKIIHYVSRDLMHWTPVGEVPLSSDYVIDACVYPMPEGQWKMWYKDEAHGSHTWAAVSPDLYSWTVTGPEIADCSHEGPNVFRLGGSFWMITDPWEGLGVYRSSDGSHWTRQENILIDNASPAGAAGHHGDVAVCGGRAFLFYHVHPGAEAAGEQYETYVSRQSWIQAAELTVQGDRLLCDPRPELKLQP